MIDILAFTWEYLIPFLFILTVLVFVHEMGHYLVARRNGVRVEVFSVGFGPEIYGWNDSTGTRWKISAVPLGGYVKMYGESAADDAEEADPALRAVSFAHKSLGQRAAIVAAGPIANFLFAIVVLALLFGILGNPMPLAGVGAVQPGTAAAEAGLAPGDRIVSVGGETVTWFEDLRRVISANPGKRVEIIVLRDGQSRTLTASPKAQRVIGDDGEARVIGLLGVAPDPDQIGYEREDPLTATWMAVERTVSLSGRILSYVGQIITGARTAEELGGPIRIAQLSGEMAQGGAVSLVLFMAALSINLGLINLFPIPMLDGGHLVYYGLEALRGRPLDRRVQEYGFRFGLILVLLLMLFATWNDLVHLKVFEFIKELVT